MKKLFIAAIIAVSFSTTAFAIDVNKVSGLVLNAFTTNYAEATNVKWTLGSTFVKASFVIDDQALEAFYTYDGSEIGTSKTIALNKIPTNALREFTKKYPFPPYQLKECIEFTNADGEINYFISLEEQKKAKIILKITTSCSISIFKTDKIK
jgi:hypothetical protein